MHILLCNDDGYQAQGIQTLARSLQDAGHRVTIVAPSEERSGQSHAMSFFRPVLVKQINAHTYSVWGTPADCAAIALLDLLKDNPPDLVMSGINHGLNVGWDVNYSGTVGAATEATLLGYKSMALSVDSEKMQTSEDIERAFQRTAELALQTLSQLHTLEWPTLEVLNINHPGSEPKGICVAECGSYGMYIPNMERLKGQGPRHESSAIYLIGGSSRRMVQEANQDVNLIQEGYVTFSFLQARQSSTRITAALKQLTQNISIK